MTRSRDFAKGATRSEFDYTATAGQTTFTGNDNDSESLSYTAGQIDVYLNGSHLNQTDDYVATNGTSVVLQSGAAAGDILHIVAYGSFNVANVIATRDLEGNELILDADNDTTITADTDDQVDIKIGGTDTVVITAGAMALKGATPTLTIGDAGAEDTKIVFDGNAQDYHIGLDDSTDDLVIGLGSALGTTSHIVSDETGAVTKPLQPGFLATATSAQDDATGGSADPQVTYGTEVFDNNADFASSTFTAPVTGKYLLTASAHVHDVTTSNTTGRFTIVTSNRTYLKEWKPGGNISGSGDQSCDLTVIADMDASDTALVKIQIYDTTNVVDIAVSNGTFFGGYLLG